MDLQAVVDEHVRKGTFLSATAHCFTAIFGSGILGLPWSIAQVGWILGPVLLVLFGAITLYTSVLLTDCYRSPDPVHGDRNRSYADAVKSLLDRKNVIFCGIVQYIMIWGTMIGYTITTVVSIGTLAKQVCFNTKGFDATCTVNATPYMIGFGGLQMILTQFPNLDEVTIISVIATITSFIYGSVALILCIIKLSSDPQIRGTLLGAAAVEGVAVSTKTWRVFQSLGNIAFAYQVAILLLEIQDTLKSPPAENKTMKRSLSVAICGTGTFYFAVSFMGYACFGNTMVGNIITAFNEPAWLVSIGNVAVIVHLVGAYQVFAQAIFGKHESWLAAIWPKSIFNKAHVVKISSKGRFRITLAKLVLRPAFVVLTTIVAMMLPFFNAVLSLLGAIAFFPLTCHFPLTMYMKQAKIETGTSKWVFLQSLRVICLCVSLLAATGAVAEIIEKLHHVTIFRIEI